MQAAQKTLSENQIERFRHDVFVDDQVGHFRRMSINLSPGRKVVDIGGGCGFFARQVHAVTGLDVRVIDSDPRSIEICRATSPMAVEAVCGDALSPAILGDEGVVSFNLILHHLISHDESSTRRLQQDALRVWSGKAEYLFVNEYIYDSYFGDLSGRLIYFITSSRLLSALARLVSRVAPSLRANTFGVGVRFRSEKSWRSLFQRLGYEVIDYQRGREESPSLLQKSLLIIRSVRRDSFLLASRSTPKTAQEIS